MEHMKRVLLPVWLIGSLVELDWERYVDLTVEAYADEYVGPCRGLLRQTRCQLQRRYDRRLKASRLPRPESEDKMLEKSKLLKREYTAVYFVIWPLQGACAGGTALGLLPLYRHERSGLSRQQMEAVKADIARAGRPRSVPLVR
jgi:hypothetical protein